MSGFLILLKIDISAVFAKCWYSGWPRHVLTHVTYVHSTTPPKSNMVDPHTHPSVRAADQVMSPRNLPIGGATSNYPHSSQFSRTRKLFDRGPDLVSLISHHYLVLQPVCPVYCFIIKWAKLWI